MSSAMPAVFSTQNVTRGFLAATVVSLPNCELLRHRIILVGSSEVAGRPSVTLPNAISLHGTESISKGVSSFACYDVNTEPLAKYFPCLR